MNPELQALNDKPGTLEEYRALVTISNCPDCGQRLPKGIQHYDHDGGVRVAGFPAKQWLYVECQNERCGYQWALWKLLRRQRRQTEVA